MESEIGNVSPTLIVGVVFVLAFVSRWLWDYNRAKREEAAEHEPKANPPLHQQFVERVDYDRDREETQKEFARQAVARKGVYAKIEEQGKEIAKLQTSSDTQTRQLAAVDRKIEDLPEKLIALIDRK